MKHQIYFDPIGFIYTPFEKPEGIPVQPPGGMHIQGSIILSPEFEPGLKDLMGFSHIILLYFFHLSRGYSLKVNPFLDEKERGLFATRAPRRPNPIGLSVVKLLDIKENKLLIEEIDVVNRTPLLDIKPYVPVFDIRNDATSGWLSNKAEMVFKSRSDGRFNTKNP